jgi:hypothetical protein
MNDAGRLRICRKAKPAGLIDKPGPHTAVIFADQSSEPGDAKESLCSLRSRREQTHGPDLAHAIHILLGPVDL